MRTTQYIRQFEFCGTEFTLSDADKLTTKATHVPAVTLKLQRRAADWPGRPPTLYPQDADLFVRTASFSPGAKTEWGYVQLIGNQPVDINGTTVGAFSLRLHDGTDSRYWGGAAWSVAGSTDWNTLADFNANLPAYTGASLAIEIRLLSTAEQATPRLVQVLLQWTGEAIDSLREWIHETVVATLKAGLRPRTDLIVAAPGGTSIDLSTYTFDNDPSVTDVTAVYDHTADPDHETDLLSSYSEPVITLTAPIALGNTAFVVAAYVPDVAVSTDSDFPTDARVPAIWITAIVQAGGHRSLGVSGPSIIDESSSPPAGTVYPLPISLLDLDFTAAVVGPTARDLLRLASALDGWFKAHPKVTSPAYDEAVSVQRGPVLNWPTTLSSVDNTKQATATWRLKLVPIYAHAEASAADAVAGSGQAPVGPVSAGDPDFPGVGYAVGTLNLQLIEEGGGGTDDLTT